MGRFNTKDQTNKKHSAIQTTGEQTRTHQGGVGVKRGAQSELYLLAVSFMGGDGNFYESSDERYNRLIEHTQYVAVWQPEWFLNFVRWVRHEAKMRTVAGVMAVEGVRARIATAKAEGKDTSQGQINRQIIDAACARADEPGEILAYYLSTYGKPLPQPLKNGLGDAARRLYTERGYLRYAASTTSSVGMADVLRLCRPKPADEKQAHLFNYITEFEHRGPLASSTLEEITHLPKVQARRYLMDLPQSERSVHLVPERVLRNAEMGWENISSWLGTMDKDAWEAVIPGMGTMAMLRNLRNFDRAGVSDEVAQDHVYPKLVGTPFIEESRVLPMRFLSAYRNVENVRWHHPLELGLQVSLRNIPELPGHTLVMIDMSGSMTWSNIGGRTQLSYADAAKIFGSVLAVRNPGVELVQYGTSVQGINVPCGSSVLTVMNKFRMMGGTDTAACLRSAYTSHDRVIIVTDEQAGPSLSGGMVGSHLPNHVPMYTWNLAGYKASHAPSGEDNRFIFGGGFSDAAFGMINLIEQGTKGTWPWEMEK